MKLLAIARENESLSESNIDTPADAKKSHGLPDNDYNNRLLFDIDIPNQDIEYLGSEKVKQLAQLFGQQVKTQYRDFAHLTMTQQQQTLHKLRGAAIAVGLVRLYHLCQTLELHCQGEQLSKDQLLMLEELMVQSLIVLNKYVDKL